MLHIFTLLTDCAGEIVAAAANIVSCILANTAVGWTDILIKHSLHDACPP